MRVKNDSDSMKDDDERLVDAPLLTIIQMLMMRQKRQVVRLENVFS